MRTAVLPRAPTALAVACTLFIVAGCTTSPTSSPSPSLEPTATPVTASPSPVAKDPAATVDELLDRLYAALTEGDNAALAALASSDAWHAVYYTDGSTGREGTEHFLLETFDVAADALLSVTRTADPMVVGDVVAVPVEVAYPDEVDVGFDLLTVVHEDGGLLVGSGYTLYGGPDLALDPGATAAVAAEVAAWTAGDADAVLATYTDDTIFMDGPPGPDWMSYGGDDLTGFVEGSVWFDVQISGDQMTSGAFLATPNRLVSDDTGDGISVHWVRDGKIVLHVWVPG
jgi:ketosteroid isomerase-like protein